MLGRLYAILQKGFAWVISVYFHFKQLFSAILRLPELLKEEFPD